MRSGCFLRIWFLGSLLPWIYLITWAHENLSPVLMFKIRLIGQSQGFSDLRPLWRPAETFPGCEKPCQPATFLRWRESRIGNTPSFLTRGASVTKKEQNCMKILLIHCSQVILLCLCWDVKSCVKTVTAVLEFSVSMAPSVSSTELSETEEDGKRELWRHWTSRSPSLSMPVVSRLNLHTNITTYVHKEQITIVWVWVWRCIISVDCRGKMKK